MSDEIDWNEKMRQLERHLGRPLSAEECSAFEKVKSEVERVIAEYASRDHTLRAFMQKLVDRQGTIMPDFDALYKKKYELDRRLVDP